MCLLLLCFVCLKILAHQKSNKMEWIIIVLIMGECVLSVVDLYLQLFVRLLFLSLSLSVSVVIGPVWLMGSVCLWCVCVGS